jgi:hypothetical protein
LPAFRDRRFRDEWKRDNVRVQKVPLLSRAEVCCRRQPAASLSLSSRLSFPRSQRAGHDRLQGLCLSGDAEERQSRDMDNSLAESSSCNLGAADPIRGVEVAKAAPTTARTLFGARCAVSSRVRRSVRRMNIFGYGIWRANIIR